MWISNWPPIKMSDKWGPRARNVRVNSTQDMDTDNEDAKQPTFDLHGT